MNRNGHQCPLSRQIPGETMLRGSVAHTWMDDLLGMVDGASGGP
jgi:hypothetical protein